MPTGSRTAPGAAPITASWHKKGDEAYYPPTWVRLDSELETNDAATFEMRYTYEPANQNGFQFGNITRREERADGALLRTTVTQFFPNPGANIVAKPARVRVLTPAGACAAEQRAIYDAVDGGYTAAPTAGRLVKTDRALGRLFGIGRRGQHRSQLGRDPLRLRSLRQSDKGARRGRRRQRAMTGSTQSTTASTTSSRCASIWGKSRPCRRRPATSASTAAH